MNLNYHFKATTMTKRFKTIVRGGKFISPSETGDFIETEAPFIMPESMTIGELKGYYRRHHSDFPKLAIDKALSDLEQCELVTIEVKVVNDIPERVKTDKTSSE